MTSQPSDAQKLVYDTAIKALEANGTWATCDALYNTAGPDAQAAQRNWIKDAHNLSLSGTPPTFVAKAGYTTNGTTSFLNTNYIPAADKVNVAQDSATLACRITAGTDAASSSVHVLGVVTGSNGLSIIPRDASGQVVGRINASANSTFTSVVPGTRLGTFSVSRTGASTLKGYYNGSAVGTGTEASTALPATNAVYAGGRNSSGTLSGPAANTFTAIAIASQWTDQQHADFHAIMAAFETAMAAT